MISGPGFEQQIEHQLQAQDAGGGTRSSGKRSHLKRQLKAPTKLSKEKEPSPSSGMVARIRPTKRASSKSVSNSWSRSPPEPPIPQSTF